MRFGLEIDQQVAAAQQVELGEGWVLDDVLHGKHHHVADLFLDLVARIVLVEEAANALGRDVLCDVGRIVCDARHCDGVIVEVGGVDLDAQFLLMAGSQFVLQFGQQDGNRVGLFAGGAASHPDAKGVAGWLARQQLGQDGLLEYDKGLWVAKEAGDVDQQLLEQQLCLLGVFAQEARVHRLVLDAMLAHAALNAPPDGAFLVEREVVPGATAQLQQYLVDAGENLLGHNRWHGNSIGRLARHFEQRRWHLFDWQDVGGKAGGDGALRHAVVFRAGGFLHHADAASTQDGAQAQRAVGGGARKDDADGALALVFGQRAQEAVDRHTLAAYHFGHRELQQAAQYAHLAIGRDDVDVIRLNPHLVERLEHRHAGAALKDFGQKADMAGVKMGHQHEGHPGVGRAGAKEGLEGFQTAGGGADADDGHGRSNVGHCRYARHLIRCCG